MHSRVVFVFLCLATLTALCSASCSAPYSDEEEGGGADLRGNGPASHTFALSIPLGGQPLLDFTATVTRCGDGDSLDISEPDGQEHRVRLHGIDCPELHQEYGPQALAATESLVLGREVRILVLDTDRYGRMVSLVVLADGTVLNEELVRGGHAWVYSHHCTQDFCAGWVQDQDSARAYGMGLWAGGNAQEPWDWRRENNNR